MKDHSKLSAKKLTEIWKSLSEEQKKPYINKYEEEKKKYEKFLEKKKLETEDEKEEKEEKEINKKKNKSMKKIAKTTKEQNYLNNNKVCNCGKCDYCKSLKKIKSKLYDME